MRAAPDVDAVLGDCRLEHMLIALLHGLAGVAVAAWVGAHAEVGVTVLGVVVLALVAMSAAAGGVWLGRKALPSGGGRLAWDGQAWQWRPHGPAGKAVAPVRVSVALDLGAWMLLRLQPPAGRRVWATASARTAGRAWHGLRVALQAHAEAAGVATDVGGRAG